MTRNPEFNVTPVFDVEWILIVTYTRLTQLRNFEWPLTTLSDSKIFDDTDEGIDYHWLRGLSPPPQSPGGIGLVNNKQLMLNLNNNGIFYTVTAVYELTAHENQNNQFPFLLMVQFAYTVPNLGPTHRDADVAWSFKIVYIILKFGESSLT